MINAPASYEEARSAIMGYFQAQWKTGPAEYMPTEYENRAFRPPAAAIYAKVSMQWGDAGAASIGTGHRRTNAILFVQIFAPEGSGMKATNEAVDKLASFLDHWSTQTTHCDIHAQTVARATVGEQVEGWYQSNAFVVFTIDARP